MIDKYNKDGELFPAYVLLMIYTGMMPGELMLAEKNMIDWEERTILGCGIKTAERKTKPIVFPEVITPVLERIVQQAKKEKLLDCGRNAFYERFRKMVSDYGFRQELTAYSCRHTTANTLALSYENIPNAAIQAVMRQRSFDSTQHYIHPDTITARNAIDRASHEFHGTSTDMGLKENIPQRDGSKKHRKKRLT